MPKQKPTRFRTETVVRAGALALSSLAAAAGGAGAVTPLSTYYGPGLPLDSYFPEGIPGTQDQLGVTVLSRARPDYDAPGIREGAFIIRPDIDESLGYNSNVVGGSIDGKASSELQSSGSISVNSDYSDNNFGLNAGISNTQYWDVPRISNTDYNVSLGGSHNFGLDQLNLSASYLSSNEEPYDIGVNGSTIVQLNKPLNFKIADFRTSYTSQFARFTLRPNLDYQLLRFAAGDFTGLEAGELPSFDQRRRDVNILQGGLIAQYEFQPERSAVLVINGNDDHYIDGYQPSIGVVDSTGATVLAGIDYQLTGATTIRALAGYQERFFNGNRFGNQGAPIGEADVIWNPTGLTTVTARYARTIEDATTDSVTGYTYDRASLVVDHELYRNILLQANVQFQNASYQSTNLQQRNYGAGAGVTYLINRNIQAALSYQFIEHTSSSDTEVSQQEVQALGGNPHDSFGQQIVMLHLKFGI